MRINLNGGCGCGGDLGDLTVYRYGFEPPPPPPKPPQTNWLGLVALAGGLYWAWKKGWLTKPSGGATQ